MSVTGSRGDKTLEKLDFYAAVGTQELLVIDRHPWKLTMYRYNASSKSLEISECSDVSAEPIASRIFHVSGKHNRILHSNLGLKWHPYSGHTYTDVVQYIFAKRHDYRHHNYRRLGR